jgi:hypothetical protein
MKKPHRVSDPYFVQQYVPTWVLLYCILPRLYSDVVTDLFQINCRMNYHRHIVYVGKLSGYRNGVNGNLR